jgi:hypothetical protein
MVELPIQGPDILPTHFLFTWLQRLWNICRTLQFKQGTTSLWYVWICLPASHHVHYTIPIISESLAWKGTVGRNSPYSKDNNYLHIANIVIFHVVLLTNCMLRVCVKNYKYLDRALCSVRSTIRNFVLVTHRLFCLCENTILDWSISGPLHNEAWAVDLACVKDGRKAGIKQHPPELSQSLLTNAFLFSSRNWLGIRPVSPTTRLVACEERVYYRDGRD